MPMSGTAYRVDVIEIASTRTAAEYVKAKRGE